MVFTLKLVFRKLRMIKVSYLVSYDYEMFLTSVKQLYPYVNKIVLAIDKDSRTWSGNKFTIPDSFFEEVKNFDKKNKIEFYFDTFYLPSLSPIECESRERNMVLKKLGFGWKIQLDVDEYIYDFETVAKYLKKYWYFCLFPKVTPICFRGKLITLYRKLDDGFLFIDSNEIFSFITNQDYNVKTRNNYKIRNHSTNINVIHQSWARSEEEIQFKIKNWGHRDDFDTQSYFDFWKSLNSSNYSEHENVHPIVPTVWNKIFFLKASSIDDFIFKFKKIKPQKLIFIEVSKIKKALLNKLFKC